MNHSRHVETVVIPVEAKVRFLEAQQKQQKAPTGIKVVEWLACNLQTCNKDYELGHSKTRISYIMPKNKEYKPVDSPTRLIPSPVWLIKQETDKPGLQGQKKGLGKNLSFPISPKLIYKQAILAPIINSPASYNLPRNQHCSVPPSKSPLNYFIKLESLWRKLIIRYFLSYYSLSPIHNFCVHFAPPVARRNPPKIRLNLCTTYNQNKIVISSVYDQVKLNNLNLSSMEKALVTSIKIPHKLHLIAFKTPNTYYSANALVQLMPDVTCHLVIIDWSWSCHHWYPEALKIDMLSPQGEGECCPATFHTKGQTSMRNISTRLMFKFSFSMHWHSSGTSPVTTRNLKMTHFLLVKLRMDLPQITHTEILMAPKMFRPRPMRRQWLQRGRDCNKDVVSVPILFVCSSPLIIHFFFSLLISFCQFHSYFLFHNLTFIFFIEIDPYLLKLAQTAKKTCSTACIFLAMGMETGELRVFIIGGATPIPKCGIGGATPKNLQNKFLGVVTYLRPPGGITATPKCWSRHLGVANPILGGRKSNSWGLRTQLLKINMILFYLIILFFLLLFINSIIIGYYPKIYIPLFQNFPKGVLFSIVDTEFMVSKSKCISFNQNASCSLPLNENFLLEEGLSSEKFPTATVGGCPLIPGSPQNLSIVPMHCFSCSQLGWDRITHPLTARNIDLIFISSFFIQNGWSAVGLHGLQWGYMGWFQTSPLFLKSYLQPTRSPNSHLNRISYYFKIKKQRIKNLNKSILGNKNQNKIESSEP
ncbi:hypothetical protein VP01_679g5 [Puccinia sorghi]|uniref:Uncharacterized protein n=1 Tax=Puccinia sorghi TaxID=27349 RepID=A0A0L6UGQ4_9BASI|nr:hypothetical protein VP01_679g5 [Puccinia sorghi]